MRRNGNHSNKYCQDLKRFPSRNDRRFHHFHYDHLRHRQSIYWLDGMYIPDWLHVLIVHKILGGGAAVWAVPQCKRQQLQRQATKELGDLLDVVGD